MPCERGLKLNTAFLNLYIFSSDNVVYIYIYWMIEDGCIGN